MFRSKVPFSDKGVPVTQPPNGPNDLIFCMGSNKSHGMGGLLWVTIEFCSSQGHVTSIEANHI